MTTLEFDDFRLHRRRHLGPLTAPTCLLGLQASFAVVAVQPHPLGQGALADAHFAGDQFRREAFLQIQLNRLASDLKRMGVNAGVGRPPRCPPRGAGLLPLPWNLAYTFLLRMINYSYTIQRAPLVSRMRSPTKDAGASGGELAGRGD